MVPPIMIIALKPSHTLFVQVQSSQYGWQKWQMAEWPKQHDVNISEQIYEKGPIRTSPFLHFKPGRIVMPLP